MEFSLKQLFKKNWLAIVTMAITIGILVYFLITTDGIGAIAKILPQIQVPWILAMFGVIFCNWALEGIAVFVIARRIYPNWTIGKSIVIGMVGLLYGAITPFSTGGQPMQVYYMHKMGMDTSKAAAIITVKTMVYQIVMVVFALVMVFWKLPYFMSQVSNFAFITLIGLAANLLFISAVFFFAFNKKATNKIVHGVVKLLSKMKIVKKPEQTEAKAIESFAMYYDSTRLIGKDIKMYATVFVLQILQILAVCLVPFCIYRSFGFEGASVITMVAAQSFVTMVSAFIPLPGASGGAEGSFGIYFQGFFTEGTLVPAMFIWRIMTYYLTIFCGCFFAVFGKRIKEAELLLNPKLVEAAKHHND